MNVKLDIMARNLIVCSEKTLNDVLDSLKEEDKEYMLIKMEEFRGHTTSSLAPVSAPRE